MGAPVDHLVAPGWLAEERGFEFLAAPAAAMFLLPLYYQQLRGETVLHAGLLLIPQGVGSLAARLVVGRLIARLGARLVTIGSFLLAAAATVPFVFAGPHTSLWLLGAVLLVRGFGIAPCSYRPCRSPTGTLPWRACRTPR